MTYGRRLKSKKSEHIVDELLAREIIDRNEFLKSQNVKLTRKMKMME